MPPWSTDALRQVLSNGLGVPKNGYNARPHGSLYGCAQRPAPGWHRLGTSKRRVRDLRDGVMVDVVVHPQGWFKNGSGTRFVSAAELIDTLSAAAKDGRLREATAEFVAPAVLVVDEVGYLHHADDAANVLFGVVDQRYLRKRPILLTTNKRLKDWGDVLHDPDLAEVILDRILERGTHIALGGPSWRRKHLPETDEFDAPAIAADRP